MEQKMAYFKIAVDGRPMQWSHSTVEKQTNELAT
jgi:hypothetical protein